MRIRQAVPADLERMLEIYEIARAFMRAHGNTEQWNNGYPSAARLLDDIAKGVSYVAEEDGRVVGTFALIPGADHTYAEINGSWLNEESYSTIHRSASDGTVHGLIRAITEFGFRTTENIRVDTHARNVTMRRTLESLGYRYCGIIHIDDGSERFAYQIVKK